jgi:glycosyltransferase involved in cell wall biosynthesis
VTADLMLSDSPNSAATVDPRVGAAAPSSASPHPRVSICIPAYQAERHLRATVDSVLAQQGVDLEVVIVDNHSSDATSSILRDLNDSRLRIIRNPATVSMVENFNLAVSMCRSEFVKLICADDVLAPTCIAAQAAVLDGAPDVALVAVQTDFIDDQGRLLRPARGLRGINGRRDGQHVVRQIVRSGTNPIGAPVAAMFRRDHFERCGGFRDDLLFVMDTDLWIRLLHHGDFVGLSTPLASFRIGSQSASASTSARSQLAQQFALVNRVCADRRWSITATDRLVGRLAAYDMQARRYGLFRLAAWRDARQARRAGGDGR